MPIASSSNALNGDRSTPYGARAKSIHQGRRASGIVPLSNIQATIDLKRYHKNWSEFRDSKEAVTLISSTGLLFAVEDFYLKANSPVFGAELKGSAFMNSEKATSRPVDLQHVQPQVISLFLDLVVHEKNRLSIITKAEQYLQVRAFAERYAVTRLFTGLQGVRDKVKENDPFGFMKILMDEAISHGQAREIETRIEALIANLHNQSMDDKQAITESAWNATNQSLAAANLPVSRARAKGPTKPAAAKLSSETQSIISQGVSEILAEVQRIYDTHEGKDKARGRIYRSDEMKETIQALQYHFYITSENHFPARWSSYGETTYSNNVVESDTPAHALPTQVAQALGIPFYRAFTFSLDDALIQQNFRSGYTRAPHDPPPFHRDQPVLHHSVQVDEAVVELGSKSEGAIPTQPEPNTTHIEERTSFGIPGLPTQDQNSTADSCAAPYQTHMNDMYTPEQQDGTFGRPTVVSRTASPENLVNTFPSSLPTQSSASTSNTARHDMPPSATQTPRKSGKRNAMDEVKREEENDFHSAFDRRDDQFDEGKQLWSDIWKGIGDYLPIEMAQFGTTLTAWDEVEDLSVEVEDNAAADIEMTEPAAEDE